MIVEKGTRLKEEFTKTPLFHVTSQQTLSLMSQYNLDAVVIDANNIPIHLLIEKIDYLEDFKHIFYIMEEATQEQLDLCKANRVITIIQSKPQDVYQAIKNILYPENGMDNRLFLFFGADHKAGTTSITHSVAHSLASMSTKKVLVVALTPFANDTFVEFSKSTIDHLRIPISSRVVTFSEVLKESDHVQNYQFVAGARDMVQALSYQLEDIIHFIEVLRKQEDYLVLIDAGSDLYNPLTVAALERVKNKFAVMKHSESYYRRFNQYISQVLSVHPALALNHQSFQYILNEFDNEVDTSTYLKDRECICVAKIPKSYHGVAAENKFNALHNIDADYKNAVEVVSNLIAIQSSSKRVEMEEKPSFFQKFFSRKKEGVVHDVQA